MPINRTTESESMKLTLNYGEGPDGKIVTRSKTYSDLKIGITNEAYMAGVDAIGSLMEPSIDAHRIVTTDRVEETV